MSKVRNAPGYEAKHRRCLRLVRWPTRGGEPASLAGFHRPENLLPVYHKLVAEGTEPPEGKRVEASLSIDLTPFLCRRRG